MASKAVYMDDDSSKPQNVVVMDLNSMLERVSTALHWRTSTDAFVYLLVQQATRLISTELPEGVDGIVIMYESIANFGTSIDALATTVADSISDKMGKTPVTLTKVSGVTVGVPPLDVLRRLYGSVAMVQMGCCDGVERLPCRVKLLGDERVDVAPIGGVIFGVKSLKIETTVHCKRYGECDESDSILDQVEWTSSDQIAITALPIALRPHSEYTDVLVGCLLLGHVDGRHRGFAERSRTYQRITRFSLPAMTSPA
jgi:hypothetical protein